MLNRNRLSKCNIIGYKQLQKKERDHFEQRISRKESSATLTVAAWNDNWAVYIAFSESSEPKRFVWCWNKVERKYNQEQLPN